MTQQPRTMPGQVMLEASHVSVRHGNHLALDDVSLAVPAECVFAILGPNGAGKSTLLKALLGLVPHVKGKIRIGSKELNGLSIDDRARSISYVPQSSALQAPLLVREIVAMGRFAHRRSALVAHPFDRQAILDAMNLADIAGLAQRTYSTLSGGEQARVLIARALAAESPIILLDEPTARLDVAHAIDCLRCLRRLARSGKAIVVVMHDLNLVSHWTDHAILLDRGRVVCSGQPGDVLVNRHIMPVYGVELIDRDAFGFRRCN